MANGDDLAAYHIWPVEARQLQDIALPSLSYDQAHSPLSDLTAVENYGEHITL